MICQWGKTTQKAITLPTSYTTDYSWAIGQYENKDAYGFYSISNVTLTGFSFQGRTATGTSGSCKCCFVTVGY